MKFTIGDRVVYTGEDPDNFVEEWGMGDGHSLVGQDMVVVGPPYMPSVDWVELFWDAREGVTQTVHINNVALMPEEDESDWDRHIVYEVLRDPVYGGRELKPFIVGGASLSMFTSAMESEGRNLLREGGGNVFTLTVK